METKFKKNKKSQALVIGLVLIVAALIIIILIYYFSSSSSTTGNVILNMANHLPSYVDFEMEVWLFGTPIQQINHNQIYSYCFSKIYSIYSNKDWVQTIDPQGIKNKHAKFWSGRTFEENAPCIQVQLAVNGEGISHDYYNQLFQLFPKIKKLIESESENIETGMIEVNFKK